MPSKLGRKRDSRKQLIVNLAISLLDYGKITTTQAKAKAVVPYLEKVFSIARQGSLKSHRHVNQLLHNKKAETKIFKNILPNIKDMNKGGFISILKLSNRNGDGSAMVIVRLNDLLLQNKSSNNQKPTKPVSETV